MKLPPLQFVVTLPCGKVRPFRFLETFNAYVKVWRESGYVVTFASPLLASVARGLFA